MVTKLLTPADTADAVAQLAREPGAIPLAGGTYLLSSTFRTVPMTVVSVARVLPADVARVGDVLLVGANATFQDLVDSPLSPPTLGDAARALGNRHIRNRATVGGNLGANRACGNLAPLCLACDAALELAGETGPIDAAAWLARPDDAGRGLIVRIRLPLTGSRRYAWRRWARTVSDASVLTACVAYDLDGAVVRRPAIALGGLTARPRRYPELEQLLDGRPLPARDDIEHHVAPLLDAADDERGSAAFKRLRAAALLAECLIHAEVWP